MGKLAERERAAKPRSTGPKCKVQKIAETLDQEDGDALRRLIYRRRDLSARDVEDLLFDLEIELADDAITRHRRGECQACKRKG
jgi:hypothetical protein